MLSIIEDDFNQIPLSFYGDIIEISSSKIYKRDGDNKINDIVERFYSIAKTQLIVGHNPGTAKVAKNYVDEKGFNFQGEEGLLRATPEGSGYWINTVEKTVKTIS